jgi:hypothetical protein
LKKSGLILAIFFVLQSSAYAAEGNIENSENNAPSHSTQYDDLGFSIGTPGVLNLEWEHVSNPVTIAVSGMYWGNTRGIQLGLAPAFMKRQDNKLRLQLIAGTSKIVPEDEPAEKWTYYGAEVVWRPRRFLLGGGLTGGSGTFSSPQLTLRIGFVWTL